MKIMFTKSAKRAMTAVCFGAVLLAAFVFAACNNLSVTRPDGTGGLSLDFSSSFSRTVQPVAAAYTCASYDISGTGPAGSTFSAAGVTGSTYSKTGLSSGSWTITVQGKNSNAHVICQKSVVLTIIEGQTVGAQVLMARVAGNGTIDVTAHWLVASDFTSVSGTLTPVGGAAQTLTADSLSGTGVHYLKTLPAGDYLLALTFSGSEHRTKTEILQVYEGFTSQVDYDMTVNFSLDTWAYTSASPVYPVDFALNAHKSVQITGAAGKSVYLVKMNSAALVASSVGSAASAFSRVSYEMPLAISQSEFIPASGRVIRMEHKASAEFNAHPPTIQKQTSAVLNGLQRNDSTAYGTADPALTVGTSTKTFWVQNAAGTWQLITATLRSSGQYCYVWVANANYGASSTANNDNLITGTQANALRDKFDGTSGSSYANGIFKNVTNIFGYEFGGGPGGDGGRDGDQHIAILVYDIDYDYTAAQSGGVLGYFWGKDYYTQTEMDDYGLKTNNTEMFYVDSHFTDRYPLMITSTLPHEFQHMIQFNEKSIVHGAASSAWFNEMCSMVAEDLVAANIGLSPVSDGAISRMPEFNYHYAESGVTDWLDANDVYKSYASAFAFGAYLERNYGGATFFKALLANPSVDTASISAALASLGYTDTFADAFAHYAEALVYTTAKPAGSSVKILNQAVTQTIDAISYTSVAFNLSAIQQYNLASGYVSGAYGPRIYAPAAAVELRPFGTSIHSQTSWQALTGSVTINLTAPSDSDVRFYLMVK